MKVPGFWCNHFLLLIASFFLLSCSVHNSSKPITRTAAYPRVIERAQKNKRYFIMHAGVDTFVVTSALVERSNRKFTVHLGRIDSTHRAYMNNPKLLAEKQIHVYIQNDTTFTLDEPHTIPLSRISRIELVQ